jgi:hypothetical protein
MRGALPSLRNTAAPLSEATVRPPTVSRARTHTRHTHTHTHTPPHTPHTHHTPRHKKRDDWWSTLRPSLDALGRDFQV